MSGIEKLHKTWDSLGRDDPLWAILSTPETRGNRWDITAFFQTGEDEVVRLFDRLRGLDISIQRGRALDFGCGVGRVTQAMAGYFDSVDGIDIAPSMIRLADQHNHHGDRCRYHVNTSPDLQLFESNTFDFVYSRIVLMHVPPLLTRRYIAEFSRVLRPGGVSLIHVPSALPPARRVVYEAAVFRRRVMDEIGRVLGQRVGDLAPATAGTISDRSVSSASYKHAMYFVRKAKVQDLLRRSGMSLICTEEWDTGDVHDVLYYSKKVERTP
jgi:SAM-dependent methyltransferase